MLAGLSALAIGLTDGLGASRKRDVAAALPPPRFRDRRQGGSLPVRANGERVEDGNAPSKALASFPSDGRGNGSPGNTGWLSRVATDLPPQRRSLFDSMSNHIANSVNWKPEIRSRATRTIVAAGMPWPMMRSTVSKMPSANPATVITIPKK